MRVKVTLACSECKQRNYNTTKNKKNNPDRIELQKYCKFCKKHTTHKETKQFYLGSDTMARENVTVSEKKVGFVRGTINELKQVTWPTKKELAAKTAVVLGVVIVSTVFVWAVDTGLSKALSLLIKQSNYLKGWFFDVRTRKRSKMVCSAYLFRS